MQEARLLSLGEEDLLEKGMASHSNILAWRIPRTEEPGGIQSMGPQSVFSNIRGLTNHLGVLLKGRL